MSATIIGGDNAEFEPEIISDNGRDGISVFQFRVVGRDVSDLYPIDAVVNNVPGQPSGSFRVVRRNLENIVEGLQRLSVSAEGGTANGLYISEAGYQYAESEEAGLVNLPLDQIKVIYRLIWLYPSVTVTTNSAGASDGPARALAQQIVTAMPVQIIQNRPSNVSAGKRITNNVRITGSSIEKSGGLWRVRATATKGQIPE
jgi:hypothetical protein